MGLFGVLATLFSAGVYTAEKTKDDCYNAKNRERAKNNGSYTYMDSYGHDRLTSTGEKVCCHGGKVYSLKEPNRVLYDAKAVYWNQRNEQSIMDAKNREKKICIFILRKKWRLE